MTFTHDTELSLVALADLVNTAEHGHGDELTDPAALDALLARCRWTGSRSHDPAELHAVRVLRDRLRPLWHLPEDAVVAQVNAILREAGALPQLVRHDGFGYHVHATSPAAPLADRMAVEFAMALVDVVRHGALDRLRTCSAGGCGHVMVDVSRNRSRRFCGPACASRVNVAAFRARRAAPPA